MASEQPSNTETPITGLLLGVSGNQGLARVVDRDDQFAAFELPTPQKVGTQLSLTASGTLFSAPGIEVLTASVSEAGKASEVLFPAVRGVVFRAPARRPRNHRNQKQQHGDGQLNGTGLILPLLPNADGKGWRTGKEAWSFGERELSSPELSLRVGNVVSFDVPVGSGSRWAAHNVRLIRGSDPSGPRPEVDKAWAGATPRQQGRIVIWFAEKNFGFVQPVGSSTIAAVADAVRSSQQARGPGGSGGGNGGNNRDPQVFLHGSQLLGGELPAVGEAVEFSLALDDEGRPAARFAQILPRTALVRATVPADFLKRSGLVKQVQTRSLGNGPSGGSLVTVVQISDSAHPQVTLEYLPLQQHLQHQGGKQAAGRHPRNRAAHAELCPGDLVSFTLPQLPLEAGSPKQDNPRFMSLRPPFWAWIPEAQPAAEPSAIQPENPEDLQLSRDFLKQWKKLSVKQVRLVRAAVPASLLPGVVAVVASGGQAGAKSKTVIQPLDPSARSLVHFGRLDVVGSLGSKRDEAGLKRPDPESLSPEAVGVLPPENQLVYFLLSESASGTRACRVFATAENLEPSSSAESATAAAAEDEKEYSGLLETAGRGRGTLVSEDPALVARLGGQSPARLWFSELDSRRVSPGQELRFRVLECLGFGFVRATRVRAAPSRGAEEIFGTIFRLLGDQTGLIWVPESPEPIPFSFEDVVSHAAAHAAGGRDAAAESSAGEDAGDAPVASGEEAASAAAAAGPQPKKQGPAPKKLQLAVGQVVRFQLRDRRAVGVYIQQGGAGKPSVEGVTAERWIGRVLKVPSFPPTAEINLKPDGRALVKGFSKPRPGEPNSEALAGFAGSVEILGPAGVACPAAEASVSMERGRIIPLNSRMTAPQTALRLQAGDVLTFAARFHVRAPADTLSACSSAGDLRLLAPRKAVVVQSQRRAGFYSAASAKGRAGRQAQQGASEQLLATLALLPLDPEAEKAALLEFNSSDLGSKRRFSQLGLVSLTFVNEPQLIAGAENQSLSRGDLVEVGDFENNSQLRTTLATQLKVLSRSAGSAGAASPSEGSAAASGGNGGDVILSCLAAGPPDEEKLVRQQGFSRPRSLRCWIVAPKPRKSSELQQ